MVRMLVQAVLMFFPLLLSVCVITLALVAGELGRGVAFLAGCVTYLIAFFALISNHGEGDREANAGVWLINAFALGGMFLVGLASLEQ